MFTDAKAKKNKTGLEEILDALRNDLNEIKEETKKKFKHIDELLFFYFDRKIGPTLFCSKERQPNRILPKYIGSNDLQKFCDLAYYANIEDGYDSNNAVINIRCGNGKKYKLFKQYAWIFFNNVNIDYAPVRGGKESFNYCIISKKSKISAKVLDEINFHLQNKFQKYFSS